MKKTKLIEDKLDDLVKLMLIKGVQPSELADNVFLCDYKSIRFYKKNDLIIGELIFEEINEKGSSVEVLLRYYYNKSNRVILIEEELNNQIKVLWDREFKEIDLLNQIVFLLRELDVKYVYKFISSLPLELSDKVKKEYEKTA
ncbi:hypothetical protein [Bacillus altitudinis]|uniref:hypothetical protein n=1 Tax=Bacillus altitudinis TaxID=293387 RepID=UPI00064C9D24|nr:hypothetical protein [Bacillus altitudinis]KLV23580.1 hypothetical protein ABW03_06715 [Bacillus altitudinis]